MQQHHSMDVTVTGDGEIAVKVQYRSRTPDLIGKFSAEVQRLAMRPFRWPNPYERKLHRAARHMPPWARETVRQHILHERATRIEAQLQRIARKRAERERYRVARLQATRTVAEEEKRPEPAERRGIGEARHRSGTALLEADRGRLSLTEMIAQERGVAPAIAPALYHHDRARGR